MSDLDTTNHQLVGSRAGHVVVMLPSHVMTPEQALTHAAWLVTMAEVASIGSAWVPPGFDDVLKAVRNT